MNFKSCYSGSTLFFTFCLVHLFLFSCNEAKNEQDKKAVTAVHDDVITQDSKDDISVKTFYSKVYNGWGYDIYRNGTLFIHQPYVPAVAGLTGFAQEGDAKKTGDFIIYKIRNGITPPSISLNELDSLHVLNMMNGNISGSVRN